MFERDMPNITLNTNGYWNLKKPLELNIEDSSGIKSYKVVLKTSSSKKILYSEQPLSLQSKIDIKVEPPRSAYAMKDKSVTLIIEASDSSKWNFLNGNTIVKEFDLKIDKKRPSVVTVAHSYKITKGGSAIVIFKAEDENLKDMYIQTSFDKKFIAQPFYKEGYYISLLAWPVTKSNFKATIVAKDYAGNSAKSYIPLYLKNKNYRISRIRISDKFLHGKIAELADEFLETQGIDNPLEQFKVINEDIRAKNEELIHNITSKVSKEKITQFNIKKMYPLKNAQVVATFGDHRKYLYNGNYISESYHLGLDLASNAMAEIKPQNSGDVVYSDFNGLYGNMPIIHHGLGLYTLYGHCSSVNVNSGDFVNSDDSISRTGKSGYAMGDHLHFGVLVQGIEVRPAEWMDTAWIKLNITDVINNAKNIIDGK
ncbi:M23 family metallopeptidase [Sulfurimonas lithotrophica]|uniref:M23 family metallopeptidase n=2 Tax=Sulfurimonas lithotrophica TaxID=2590022 RepID=A0A5P8P3Y0_9BACT|nr:M23 family metallopeptidase [Sulfurimonas lithotrophica]